MTVFIVTGFDEVEFTFALTIMTFELREDVGVFPPFVIVNGPIAPDFDFTGVSVGFELVEVTGPFAPDVPTGPDAFAGLVVNESARARMNRVIRIAFLFTPALPSKSLQIGEIPRKGSRS